MAVKREAKTEVIVTPEAQALRELSYAREQTAIVTVFTATMSELITTLEDFRARVETKVLMAVKLEIVREIWDYSQDVIAVTLKYDLQILSTFDRYLVNLKPRIRTILRQKMETGTIEEQKTYSTLFADIERMQASMKKFLGEMSVMTDILETKFTSPDMEISSKEELIDKLNQAIEQLRPYANKAVEANVRYMQVIDNIIGRVNRLVNI